MAEPHSDAAGDTAGGAAVFGCALVFWLALPFPFWLLGSGFAGEFVLLPSRWDLLSILWMIGFYGPLAVMAFVAFDSVRVRYRNRS